MKYETKTCRRCRKKRVMFDDGHLCAPCATIRRREADNDCIARIWHGPGHQSSTFCEESAGTHTMFKGRKLHRAYFGGGWAEWFGLNKFTGYFDELPESPRGFGS